MDKLEVDYVIVGGGFAAMFLAHQLIMARKRFVLFSSGHASASLISAGIVNPVVLKKFTNFWLAQEQIASLKDTLSEIEAYTGENFLIDEKIYRIFHDEKEQQLWQKKAKTEALAEFLDTEVFCLAGVENPFGAGKVNHSARLDVHRFFNAMHTCLEQGKALIKEKFDHSRLQGNSYGKINFGKIVFCEGAAVLQNPFFKNLPVKLNKGHHLTVRLQKGLPDKRTVKKKHFLFPVDDTDYYYGGTYDRNSTDEGADDEATFELTEGLAAFYKKDFTVQKVSYAFRPTVADRRPILGSHPEKKDYFVFNGLGARGILNGCYFSEILFKHMEAGVPLPPEVDLKRFKNFDADT